MRGCGVTAWCGLNLIGAIFLTPAGAEIASLCATRHNLVVRFLRALGVNEADADADAEGIEHHISDATLRAMERFISQQH